MGIVCVLVRDPLMVPCAECYEDHCGKPGCHMVHGCWPCFMEYVNTYLPHGGPEVCLRHRISGWREPSTSRMRAAYRRRQR